MSQSDYVMPNVPGASVRVFINAVLAAIRSLNSGAAEPSSPVADMLWVDTTSNVIRRRNSGNSAWVVHESRADAMNSAKTAAYTAVVADHGTLIRFTGAGGWTLAAAAVATLGDGWWIDLRNDSSGVVTIDPNASETVDGGTTLVLAAGQSCRLRCTGAALFTVGLAGGAVTDTTRVDVASAATVNLTAAGPAATRSINITGTTTITAFTIAVGRLYFVRFDGTLTLTNNAAIVTNTGASVVTRQGDTCVLRATAANVVEVVSYTPAALMQQSNRSMVRLNTANGYGSTNTVIRRFSNVVTNVGSDISYSDSATLGASFTINTPGLYVVSYTDSFSAGNELGLSLNSSQLTTGISSITAANRLCMSSVPNANNDSTVCVPIVCAAGDVIRPHTNGTATGTGVTHYSIARAA